MSDYGSVCLSVCSIGVEISTCFVLFQELVSDMEFSKQVNFHALSLLKK